MFENLKLRARILAGYSAPIGLSIVAAGFVLLAAQQAKQKSDQVQTYYDISDAELHLEVQVLRMQASARGYFIGKDPTLADEYKDAKKEIVEWETKLNALVQDPKLVPTLARLKNLGNQVGVMQGKLVDIVATGKSNEATQEFQQEQRLKLTQQLEVVTDEFEAYLLPLLEDSKKAIARDLGFLNILIVLSTLSAAALSVAIAYLISNATTKVVGQSALQVASSSSEIAATLEQQDQTLVQQATSVNETTTTIEELGASSRQSAEQAEASAIAARDAITVTETGLKSVQQTTNGLNNLKDKVRGIAEQIMSLSEQTGQISGVTAVVADIANQTNMLALNAAVEAARAGESGRGFAVVAGEIRKLADESKKSAERINQLILDVQSAMNSTVMVTDEGTKTADASIQLAQGTADAFNTVSAAVNNVFLNNQQIALSAKQQAVAVQQVVSAMNAINLGSRETVSSIAQVKAVTNQLNSAAKDLSAIV
jgi:methyl-accepting chemotaxis protein